ncbi:MAG TPA: DUF2177 family protein [Roseiarcus sp.]|nr:DUF2177 family protein [Roseiarcus sp.]
MTTVNAYFSTLISFVLADALWLVIMVDRLYKPTIGELMSSSLHLPAVVVFYLIVPAGLVYFAVMPGLRDASLTTAGVNGALYGFFTYATYDLTNQATLRQWSTKLTVVDMTWGVVLGALAALVGFVVASRLARLR